MTAKAVEIRGKWYVRVNYQRSRKQVSAASMEEAFSLADRTNRLTELFGIEAFNHLAEFNKSRTRKFISASVSIHPDDLPAQLLNHKDKLKEFIRPRIPACIYFLCLSGEVIYVGQSQNLPQRVLSHEIDERKVFDRILYLNVPKSKLSAVESVMVSRYKPALNKLLKYSNANQMHMASK